MSQTIRIAVSLPEPIVKAVDDLAESRGETRGHFIASLLRRVASVKRDRDISAEIDALFSDPDIRAEQKETAELFSRVSPWRSEMP